MAAEPVSTEGELRALSDAATEGPWRWLGPNLMLDGRFAGGSGDERNTWRPTTMPDHDGHTIDLGAPDLQGVMVDAEHAGVDIKRGREWDAADRLDRVCASVGAFLAGGGA